MDLNFIDVSEREFIELAPGAITTFGIRNIEGSWTLMMPNGALIGFLGSLEGETQGSYQCFKIGVAAQAPLGYSSRFVLEGGGGIKRVIIVRVTQDS